MAEPHADRPASLRTESPPADTPSTTPRAVPPRNQAVWDAVSALVRKRETVLGRPLRVLDLGGGTGGLAVPLAELGHEVTVVDPSPNALATLERRAADFGVADRVIGRQGDADSIAAGVAQAPAGSDDLGASVSRGEFDLVCCHGVLEVVDDPAAALAGIVGVLAPQGHLSLLVAGRLAVVLAKALAGDVAQATEALTSADGRWGRADPLPRRFDVEGITGLLDQAGLETLAIAGVRVFTDLVPSAALDSAADREALAVLERAVADHPRYAAALGNLGSGLHAIARRV